MKNHEITKKFLECFPGHLYQVFDDDQKRKDPSLAACVPPADWSFEHLEKAEERGCGLFFSVNGFPSGRRMKVECGWVNAWFAESDNLPLKEQEKNIKKSPLEPSFVVKAKKSYHCYWLAKDGVKANFKNIQLGLAKHFDGDTAMKDIARVLRIPGSRHQKNPDKPTTVELITFNPDLKYTEKEMKKAFPYEEPTSQPTTLYDKMITQTADNFWQTISRLDNKMVLERLSGKDIVDKQIFTFRKRNSGGEYIDVNGQAADCWLDDEGYIGSGKGGGPSWIQWLSFYDIEKSTIAEWAKENLAEFLPDEPKEFKPVAVKTKKGSLRDRLLERYKETKSPYTWGFEALDSKMPIVERGSFVVLWGQHGCLSEDSFINYQVISEDGKITNHKGGSIKRLYERFHGIRRDSEAGYSTATKNAVSFKVPSINEKDEVFQNPVADVVKCGVKECFSLKTKSGEEVTSTKDHKYYVGNGEYKPLEELSVGDTVFIHNNTQKIGKKERKGYKETTVKYHPTLREKKIDGYYYCRVGVSHLVYEADMNGLVYEEYIYILNNLSRKEINKLKFIPKTHDIHHKDKNRKNDVLGNLEMIEKKEHYRMHAEENDGWQRFVAQKDKIVSITSVGEKETYDIKCFHPYNNFIANKIVVHNSGKTLFSFWSARQNSKKVRTTFLSLEMTEEQIVHRYILQRAGIGKEQWRGREADPAIVDQFLPEVEKINFVGIDEGKSYGLKEIEDIIIAENPEIFYIDNLNKISGKTGSEIEVTQDTTAGLLKLSRAYNIPIVLIHHANKQTEKKKKKKDIFNFRGMSGLRGSNKTNDDADIIVEIARPDPESADMKVYHNATFLRVYKDRDFDYKRTHTLFYNNGDFSSEELEVQNMVAKSFGDSE